MYQGVNIYTKRQQLALLQVPFPLIKSLILIIFVIPEKVLIRYCPAQKYKYKVCPCSGPPYSCLTPTVPQARLPFIIGMAAAIPGGG